MTRSARAFPKCFSATAGMLALGLLHTFMLSLRAEPIRLHPGNPHYFLWRGDPAILITAGEHYGAVLNRDFDYRRYLEELKSHRFNLTRIFSGTYREVPGSFNITGNTLAPAPGRFLCPWARSQTPGAADGGNKFDLTKWDENYFARLKDFMVHADSTNPQETRREFLEPNSRERRWRILISGPRTGQRVQGTPERPGRFMVARPEEAGEGETAGSENRVSHLPVSA